MDTMSRAFKHPPRSVVRLAAFIALIVAHPGLWAQNQPSFLHKVRCLKTMAMSILVLQLCLIGLPRRDARANLNHRPPKRICHLDTARSPRRCLQHLAHRRIKAHGTNLGLPNAHEADLCLDCHADNVPTAMRGPEFDITDGVGCEACHGGSETWAALHTVATVTDDELRQAGLYPAHDPVEATALPVLSFGQRR